MPDINDEPADQSDAKLPEPTAEPKPFDIKDLIYIIRGQQVMLDSDLAMLYQTETKVFNQTVRRNIERFPENFMFQLTTEEYENLRSQIVTSSRWGGRRYLPYAFTEQGIAMLSGVLKSSVAVEVSIRIMNTFVEMRRFISNNAMLFERISAVELKQLRYQEQTDQKLEQIFNYLSGGEPVGQKIFFEGQIYDAFSLLIAMVREAQREILLVDGYVDVDSLNILAHKGEHVSVLIYTSQRAKLTDTDVKKFNAQYPKLEVKYTKAFHDRFMILDRETVYHIGASIKDAGKKCFAISRIMDEDIVAQLLKKLGAGKGESDEG